MFGFLTCTQFFTRCCYGHVQILGTGPLKRRMRTRGFIKSFLQKWERLFLSLDGNILSFYKKKTSQESYLHLKVSSMKSVRTETSSTKIPGYVLDSVDVVLTSSHRDIIKIKYVSFCMNLLYDDLSGFRLHKNVLLGLKILKNAARDLCWERNRPRGSFQCLAAFPRPKFRIVNICKYIMCC